MFSFVTFVWASAPWEVGVVSSTRARTWAARNGTVAGNGLSVVVFFFRSTPFAFGHLLV